MMTSQFDGTQARKLLIVGAGGSGREVAWLARDTFGLDIDLTFAVEPDFLVEDTIDDIPVIALDSSVAASFPFFVVAVGNGTHRGRLARRCEELGMRPVTLVHPSVVCSSRIEIGAGSIVCANSVLTTNVRIGRHTHVNIACTLSHDVTLGDFATLSPGVHISGHVEVESGTFLGIGANVINGSTGVPLVIGKDAIVAAGACVTKSVPPSILVAGVPAVFKRRATSTPGT